MNASHTSIESYYDHLKSGRAENQYRRILNAFRMRQEFTRRELASAIGIDLSSICGRVNELIGTKQLKEGPPRKCSITGRNAKPLSLIE